ncbi:MAG: ISL3 family transposase [Thermoflexales bacterium]|nr:ISL3 family transposase [Thermoflexales bacterium]
MNILNLPDWEVLDVEENQGDYLITARYIPGPASCPVCKRMLPRLQLFGTKQRCFMDLPIHAKRVGILVRYQRYRCKECGHTFVQELPDMHEERKMTRRLLAYIEQETLRRTFVSVADDVGMGESSVRSVFHDYAARLEKSFKSNVTPRWLGIDEIKIIKRPRCVIANVEKNTIVDLLEDRTKKKVTRYLMGLSDRHLVELVAMDMWGPYRDAVRAALPGAVIVIDKFHVVRMANASLDAVRKSIRDGLTRSQCNRLMHDRFILLRRKAELEPDKRLILDVWLDRFPALGAAYKLKEDFFDIWDTPQSSQAAIERYEEWKAGIPGDVAWAFEDLTTAVQNWETEIFAYFDHRVTNAYTESLNNITRLIYRVGRGYSFEAIRAKMLFNGGLHIECKPTYARGRGKVKKQVISDYQPIDQGPELNYGVRISTVLQRLEGKLE